MGKYHAYPEYKDSGVEWIGEIPAHWNLTKIRYITECLDGKRVPLNATERGDMQGDIPYWGANSIVDHVNDWLFDEELVLIGEDGAPFFDRTKSVAFNVLGKVWPNNHVHVLRPIVSKINPKYLTYSLNNVDYHLYITGSTRDKLNQSDLNAIIIRYCPTQEQESIANFLDHETAKIDTLIKKQLQLIQLLKEKRQAVISHAVTKGLNPNAPMKDSGVEWLGEVPEGWVVTRLKYHTNMFEQGWSPQCDSRPAEGDEYGVLKVGCVNQGVFNCTENKALPKELEPQLQYLLKRDDLLISRANTKELVGSAAVVDGDYDNLLLCDKLYRIRFDHLIVPQLVAYYLALPIVRQQIELEASGASQSMQNIGQSTIKELPIVIPPRDEADELIIKFQEKMDIFNSIHKRASDQIQLLQERRTALISAAVTGKIDVRDWQAAPVKP